MHHTSPLHSHYHTNTKPLIYTHYFLHPIPTCHMHLLHNSFSLPVLLIAYDSLQDPSPSLPLCSQFLSLLSHALTICLPFTAFPHLTFHTSMLTYTSMNIETLQLSPTPFSPLLTLSYTLLYPLLQLYNLAQSAALFSPSEIPNLTLSSIHSQVSS